MIHGRPTIATTGAISDCYVNSSSFSWTHSLYRIGPEAMTKRAAVRTALRAVATGTFATALLGLAPHTATAAPVPAPLTPGRAQRHGRARAATAPETLDTLARFFAADRKRSGARAVAPAPRGRGAHRGRHGPRPRPVTGLRPRPGRGARRPAGVPRQQGRRR